MPITKRKRSSTAAATKAVSRSVKTSAFSRAGRPLKKAKHGSDNSFVDSSLALEDMSTDEESLLSSDDEGIVTKSRRRLSPSPDLPDFTDPVVVPDLSDNDSIDLGANGSEHGTNLDAPEGEIIDVQPLQIVLKVPKGPARQVTVNVQAATLQQAGLTTGLSAARQFQQASGKRRRSAKAEQIEIRPTFSKDIIKNAGLFGRLPTEVRDPIYLLLFQAARSINLGRPGVELRRSAAFLRTCRLVYEEGRIVLYSRNQFYIERSSRSYGSLWASQWRELDYNLSRTFMKSIGTSNIALLRNVVIEAVDLGQGGLHRMTAEERRAANNETLLSVMRSLARYAELRFFRIEFRTRKFIDRTDQRFVHTMTRIKADKLELKDFSHTTSYMRTETSAKGPSPAAKEFIAYCSKKMVRKAKLHPETKEHWDKQQLKYRAVAS